MKKYLSVEEALNILLNHISPQQQVNVLPLLHAEGKICAENIYAGINQPPFDRSPLDGYAVFHSDIQNASRESPVILTVNQEIYAGDNPSFNITTGYAAKIATGAKLPDGATCVVRQEDTNFNSNSNKVTIYVSHDSHENYCFCGEDVKEGQLLVEKGTRLGYAQIGVLAGQGLCNIPTYTPKNIAVLSTGSELSEMGKPLSKGEIYDSNGPMLSIRGQMLGSKCQYEGPIRDNPELLAKKIQLLLEDNDLVITTGGVSVGQRDYMPQVGNIIEADELFYGVSIKPGSPVLALKKHNKLIICLSGNPFAATATFELLVVPVIKKLLGYSKYLPEIACGILQEPFHKSSRCRRLVRAKITGDKVYIPKSGHASGCLFSLMDCNCMIDISAGSPALQAGQSVSVVFI